MDTLAARNWTKLVKTWFVVSLIAVLSACSSSEEEPDESVVEGQNGNLSAQLTNSTDSSANVIIQGTSAIISVKLTDRNNAVINNQAISFATDKGTLSSESRLTGSDGTTEVSVSTNEVSTGIVTVTVSTILNGETLNIDILFEVQEEDAPDPNTSFNLTLVMVGQDGNVTNRITSGTSAQLQATLTDENEAPIADHPVSFTADIGVLSAPSTLTNSSGIASVTLTTDNVLGAGFASTTVDYNSTTESDSFAYEITQGVVVDNIFLGYFDDENTFIAEQIDSSNNVDGVSTINAGATLGLEFAIVDENQSLITEPLSVTFTSSCVATGDATVDATVTSVNGRVRATYKDISCATVSGNEDTIVATLTASSQTYTLTHDITIQPEDLGSIEFVSAEPDSIVIKGTGGQGKQETSVLTFLVKGELGNPVEQQLVEFSLTSTVGGTELTETSGLTNSEGFVSAIVKAGTVPTAVRVNASVTTENGDEISSQSDLLSINTGLPDQNSITLSFSRTNPEARNKIGEQITVSAFMADSFNNPVPDGTTINFTTEGGAIEAFCHTTNGSCSVLWTSQEPYQANHRSTILAYAIGHESFVDVNGNNLVDDNDGASQNSSVSNMNAVDAGFERPAEVTSAGFLDLQEAWRDDNENSVYESGELFIDYNNNGAHDAGDGFFNGPQCDSATLCPETASNLLTVRKAKVLITSSSSAMFSIRQTSDNAIIRQRYGNREDALTSIPSDADSEGLTGNAATIARGDTAGYLVQISDTAFQALPAETQISMTSNTGLLSGTTEYTMGNTAGTDDPDGFGGLVLYITLTNNYTDEDVILDATIEITSQAPSGIISSISFVVPMD